VTLTAEPPDPKRRSRKWTVRVDGKPPEKVDPDDGTALRRACKHLGVEPGEVLAVVAEARVVEETLDGEVIPEPTVIRAWTGTAGAIEVDTFAAALDSGHQYISVSGPGWAMVDVDVLERGWSADDVERITQRAAAPVPLFAWPTRSAGYRAVFESLESAGLWCLLVHEVVNAPWVEKVELVTTTRRPPNECVEGDASCGVTDLRAALLREREAGTAHPDAVQAWLAAHGMEKGVRYPHEKCPWSPSPSHSNDSVEAYDYGVTCYRCHQRISWAALVAGSVDAEPIPAVRMALELVHWEHAQWVLAACYPAVEPVFLRAGYRALLTLLHPEPDVRQIKRLRGVWDKNRAYVRSQALWLRTVDYQHHRTLSRASLLALPWTRGIPDRVDMAEGDATLAGYAPIEPVLHLVERPTWHRDTVLVPQPVESARAELDLTRAEAEDHLREALPDVSDAWLRFAYLAVVGALRAQLRLPTPVFMYVVGETGSGKDALAAFVAGVMGTAIGELRFDTPAEFSMSIGQSLQDRCSVLWGNEAGKADGWWQKSSVILKMGATHTWRQLYVGDTVTPVRAAIMLGGSTESQTLASMPELDRRTTYLHLPGRKHNDWGPGVKRYLGVSKFETLRRTGIGASIAEAYIRAGRIDARRDEPWPEVADSLGGARLSSTDDAKERDAVVEKLWALWKAADPKRTIVDGKWTGWMRCWRAGVGDEAAAVLWDWLDPEGTTRKLRAQCASLNTVSLHGFQLRVHGRRPACRFK